MADWLRETADGSLLLSLHIQPGAKQTGFAGLHGEAMKLRLAASSTIWPKSIVALTMIGLQQRGRMCLNRMRRGGAPAATAASTCSRSRIDSTCARISRA